MCCPHPGGLSIQIMNRKRLPIGIQTFSKLREDGCYYVDKTGFALRLIESGTHYFLSRPRRFGKSLFLDTLAEVFAGNEPLFRGLHIHDRWDWSRRYPVVRLSFGGGLIENRAALDQKIGEQLRINQAALGVTCTEPTPDAGLAELIRAVHTATGERAVVLVDEYDKPILDNLTRLELAVEVRNGLRNLYSVIKDSDAHVRFVFLTGVSKFSKVSLTIDPQCSAICGYTEQDLDQVFAPELAELDRDQIRHWYNGYNWTGEAVYNPFDLLLFERRRFHPFWFETGTPRFLIDLLTERQTWLPRLGQLETDATLLSAFDVGHITTEALMFQTGYLTIAAEEQLGGSWFYRLRYPNHEVYQSLNNALLEAWTPDTQANVRSRRALHRLLLVNDFAGLQGLIAAFFDAIPGEWHTKNPIANYEGYYASVFYALFAAAGIEAIPEESSRVGRLDLAVRFNAQVYLFEFKVVELESEGRALQQIKDRGYADKYRAEGQSVHLIGVEFSRTRRTLVGFEVERAA
jgi:hypothetical protein